MAVSGDNISTKVEAEGCTTIFCTWALCEALWSRSLGVEMAVWVMSVLHGTCAPNLNVVWRSALNLQDQIAHTDAPSDSVSSRCVIPVLYGASSTSTFEESVAILSWVMAYYVYEPCEAWRPWSLTYHTQNGVAS